MPEPPDRAPEGFRHALHDVLEYPAQFLAEARGLHQGDDPLRRIQAHAAEPPIPVQPGQFEHRLRMGPEVVDRGTERADETGRRFRGARGFDFPSRRRGLVVPGTGAGERDRRRSRPDPVLGAFLAHAETFLLPSANDARNRPAAVT